MDEARTLGQGSWSGGMLAVGATVPIALLAGGVGGDGGLLVLVILGAPFALLIGSLSGCAVAGIALGCPRLRRHLPLLVTAGVLAVVAPVVARGGGEPEDTAVGLGVGVVLAVAAGLHAELLRRWLRREQAHRGGRA